MADRMANWASPQVLIFISPDNFQDMPKRDREI
jgi:hypothetical protein